MWFRRQKHREELVASEQAILDATKAKKRVEDRNPEVRAVAKTLKEIRERNHFAEQLRIIIERG
jgi:hypothetical protein